MNTVTYRATDETIAKIGRPIGLVECAEGDSGARSMDELQALNFDMGDLLPHRYLYEDEREYYDSLVYRPVYFSEGEDLDLVRVVYVPTNDEIIEGLRGPQGYMGPQGPAGMTGVCRCEKDEVVP